MRYKIAGAILAFGGLFLIAKYKQHLAGLLLIVAGVYLAVFKR